MPLFSRPTPLCVGDRAPVVPVLDQLGQPVDLAEVYARGPALFFFFLRAGTPVCTAHACRLRAGFADLKAQGIQVFGVSQDEPARLQTFREKNQFPYALLSDVGGGLTRAFHVPIFLGFPARSAFLVREGLIARLGKAGRALDLLAQ